MASGEILDHCFQYDKAFRHAGGVWRTGDWWYECQFGEGRIPPGLDLIKSSLDLGDGVRPTLDACHGVRLRKDRNCVSKVVDGFTGVAPLGASLIGVARLCLPLVRALSQAAFVSAWHTIRCIHGIEKDSRILGDIAIHSPTPR